MPQITHVQEQNQYSSSKQTIQIFTLGMPANISNSFITKQIILFEY